MLVEAGSDAGPAVAAVDTIDIHNLRCACGEPAIFFGVLGISPGLFARPGKGPVQLIARPLCLTHARLSAGTYAATLRIDQFGKEGAK